MLKSDKVTDLVLYTSYSSDCTGKSCIVPLPCLKWAVRCETFVSIWYWWILFFTRGGKWHNFEDKWRGRWRSQRCPSWKSSFTNTSEYFRTYYLRLVISFFVLAVFYVRPCFGISVQYIWIYTTILPLKDAKFWYICWVLMTRSELNVFHSVLWRYNLTRSLKEMEQIFLLMFLYLLPRYVRSHSITS